MEDIAMNEEGIGYNGIPTNIPNLISPSILEG